MQYIKRLSLVTTCSTLFFTSASFAQLSEYPEGPVQQCYAVAMIGYDTVINSRLGVPADEAVDLARIQKSSVDGDSFAPFLLKVVLEAYMWQSSPHSYAVKVMYNCASTRAPLQTAQNADENLTGVF